MISKLSFVIWTVIVLGIVIYVGLAIADNLGFDIKVRH